MRKLLARLYPLFLLLLALLAYGLWINRLGFYWDDFPLAWIARTYGGEGLARYFSTNRPFWGLLYRLTTPLLGSHPLAWQVFALFWRWVSALLFWQLVRLAWPKHEETGRWAAALFLVYPGFSEQYISLVYSHFFIVLSSFLGSQCLMLLAARRGKGWGWLLAASWLLSAVNLLCMEYFFLLDLLRPLLLWVVQEDGAFSFRPGIGAAHPTTEQKPGFKMRQRIGQVMAFYAPFLALFLGVVVWRTFFFGFHTYQPTLTSQLRAAPLSALLGLAGRALSDVWTTAGLAWSKPFDFSGFAKLTTRQIQINVLVSAAAVLLCLGYFLLLPKAQGERPRRKDWLSFLAFGLAALLAAGGPFWLTGLPVSLSFHTDRFNIAFMSGAVLLLAGLLAVLPLPRWVKVVPLALVLGFSAALQYRNSLDYYSDWSKQRSMFWQMTWRMPGLQPGTILLANELPVVHYSDNSLTAPLNWIFAPDNYSQEMSYMLYYPTVRLGRGLPKLEKGLPVIQDYLAAGFKGQTSQVVVVYYQPPGCLRVMDPEVEADIWLVPPSLRETLKLASTAPILSEGQAQPPAGLYGSEPERNWCYYFEKGDLARQQKDWTLAASLGDQAFALKDYPNDPVERFPFIEAYAHTGQWDKAIDLTQLSRDIAPLYAQLGCKLWTRIARETQASSVRDGAVLQARQILGCSQ
jgi:hypothetical protein